MDFLMDFLWDIENTPSFAFIITFATLLLLLIFLVTLSLNIKNNRKWLRKNKRVLLVLAGIFVLGLFLRANMFAIHFPRGGGDFFYVAAARNMARYGRFQTCDYVNYCLPPKKPYLTYPLITSIAFTVLEPSVKLAAWVNILLSSVSVIVMYFASKAVFKNERAALLSSLLLMLLVSHMFYANTAGPHSSSVLFLLLSVLGFCLFFEKKNFLTHIFALSALGLCISSRLDHWGMLFFFGLWYLIKFRELKRVDKKTLFIPILIFSLLMLPNAMMVYPFAFHEGSDASDFSFEYVSSNLDFITRSFFQFPFMEMWFVLLLGSLGGVLLLAKRLYIVASFLFPTLLYLSTLIVYEYATPVHFRYLLPGIMLCLMIVSYIPASVSRKLRVWKVEWVLSFILLIVFITPFVWMERTRDFYIDWYYPLYEFTTANKALLNSCQIIQCEGRVSWAVLDTKVYPFVWDDETVRNPEHLKELAGSHCVYYIETTSCFYYRIDFQRQMHQQYNLTLVKEEWYDFRESSIRLYEVNLDVA